MTQRIRLDDLTSDQLDQLYERMAIYRAAWHSARGRAAHQRSINADLRTELTAKTNRAKQAEATVARVRAARDRIAQAPGWVDAIFCLDVLEEALGYNQPAHNAGPSIRECADQDAAHWSDKYAGEGQ